MEIPLIAILALLASGVGTLTGFGTSTIMVPVLVTFYALPQTLLLVGIVHWFGDIWKVLLFKRGIRWRLIASFGIPGIAAGVAGGFLVFELPQAFLARGLGALLLGYVGFLFVKERFKVPSTAFAAAAGGALSGFFAGVFGLGGAIRGAFLAAFDLPKAVYIATAGMIALAVDTVRLATYYAGGTRLEPLLLWGLLAFVPASFVGAKLAEKMVGRIPQQRFRSVIAGFLCLVGLKLLIIPT